MGKFKVKNLIKSQFQHLISEENEVLNLSKKSHYTNSFGYQWSIFDKVQLDSKTGINWSQDRFRCTNWTDEEIYEKVVLEIGSGAGRFTEILLKKKAKVITTDSSDAIFTNFKNNSSISKNNIYFLKTSTEEDIFQDSSFDYVFCYGVIQHTSDPFLTLDNLINKLKVNGKLSVDFYKKSFLPNCWTTPKYLWRPLTKRIKKELLLKIIRFYMPIYLPIDTFLKKIFGRLSVIICGFIPIPCWNYYFLDLDYSQKLEIAILDTFDALSPEFDKPFTKKEIKNYLANNYTNLVFDIFDGSNGIVLNIEKKSK